MNVGVCDWTFRAVRDSSLNAGSEPNGLITVNRGVVEYAANEEQVCMVIAHEMGHEAANHLAASRRNQTIGAVVGAVLLGAAGVALSGGRYGGADAIRSAMDSGANIGGAIGGISFSKEQEREADYLAALILYRAGVDLDKARGLLVTMARASSQRETGILDTHPAGPERRKTPTPPQRCWGGSDDAVSESAPGSATATLRLKFGLPRDEFLRDRRAGLC
jgi:predicted Zn-dependent protease